LNQRNAAELCPCVTAALRSPFEFALAYPCCRSIRCATNYVLHRLFFRYFFRWKCGDFHETETHKTNRLHFRLSPSLYKVITIEVDLGTTLRVTKECFIVRSEIPRSKQPGVFCKQKSIPGARFKLAHQ